MMRTTQLLALFGFTLAACSGSGSDIGPRFSNLPSASSKVLVLDDQGRGVVGAAVEVVGGSGRALTGRNGRADLFVAAQGSVLLRVLGANGAAVSGDELGSLLVTVPTEGGDFPWPLYLADVQASTGGPIAVGTQVSDTVIDDDASSGIRLTIPNGSSLGLASGAATVTIRTGSLLPEHLCGTLPGSGQPVLLGRGIYLDPPEWTCAPGATLDVVDDLALGSGTALLYHLDPDTGVWGYVDTGIVSSGGRLVSTGVVTEGGYYAFGVSVAAGSVFGRIVDASTPPIPLPRAAVVIDGRHASTASDGTFTIDGIPAATATGGVRTAAVEVFAGGAYLPVRTATTVALGGPAPIDLGDVVLDTLPAGNLRIQLVKRGRGESMRRSSVSSEFGSVALVATSDASGQVIFEDVPSRWFGFQDGHLLDRFDNFYAQGVGYMEPGRRWTDGFQFFDKRGWFLGSRRSRVLITDAVGGGPLYDGVLVGGSADNAGFVGLTRESGLLIADRPLDGRATATFRSERDGQTIVHAFSIDTPNGEHLEMPMQQVLRAPLGAFDRHGIVAGTLTGANGAREHRLRATRRMEAQEWWEDVVEGRSLRSSLPIDIDPATTHAAFRAGVPAAGGHLVVAELATAGPVTTLEKLGVAADLQPTEGEVLERDLALDLAASATFVAPSGLVGLDASIAVADLTMSLLLEQPSGRGIDIVRGIGGNHAAAGDDLQLTLPALSGSLAGHRWRVLMQGEATNGGVVVKQRSLLRLEGSATEATVPFLPVPTITSPSPAATVAASGFTVEYTVPDGTLYATIELRSESSGELYLWDVVLPPTAASFAFHVLPTEAATPLVAGRSYSLTVSAFRALTGPLLESDRPYDKLTSFLQSIGALERGVDAVSSSTIQVTTN
jgi:hypothetical protein